MTLRVHTARLSYVGPDRLDITRAGADAYRKRTGLTWEGEPWAPSWTIVWPIIKLRREVRDTGAYADSVLLAAWRAYEPAFTEEMRRSYRRNRPAWDALLARSDVTLCCTCVNPVALSSAHRCRTPREVRRGRLRRAVVHGAPRRSETQRLNPRARGSLIRADSSSVVCAGRSVRAFPLDTK